MKFIYAFRQLKSTYIQIFIYNMMATMTYQPYVPGSYNPFSMVSLYKQPICSYMNITIPRDWMKYVIGTNGYFFNVITHQSGVQYIWYHKSSNLIEIWGYSDEVINNAKERLQKRMNTICVEMLIKNGMYKKDEQNQLIRINHVKWADMEEEEEQ